jgi:hypothetical protein
MPTPPQALPESLQAIWLSAARDGWACGQRGGWHEQNPYELYEPLWEAWREGWLEGVVPIPELGPTKLKQMILWDRTQWKERCKRYKEFINEVR